MSTGGSILVCPGCGASPPPEDPYPFTCPNRAIGDVDHVLVRVLDTDHLRFPGAGPSGAPVERQPFVRYRTLLHSYHRALSGEVADERFVSLVRDLDDRVAQVEGHGFSSTPFIRSAALSSQLGFSPTGGVWVKDETGNVAGSHKGRHLMGILLHLEVAELLGQADPGNRPVLAIASCGNAALAAAVVAAAAGRALRVFVPADAEASITARLAELGAEIEVCRRAAGVTGDPTYARLKEDLARGALPFTCQGNLNGLTIEGGETLGYEIVSDLVASGLELDHLVVQVGGGALASSCVQAFSEAAAMGAIPGSPAVHTVQTQSAHPLERAYHLLRAGLPDAAGAQEIEGALRDAAGRRSKFMWPWESEPKSIASGILDDETYDWLAVVRGMLMTGGRPLVVGEDLLSEAHELGRLSGFDVDATGSASLAGLLDLGARGALGADERVAVLFTGVER